MRHYILEFIMYRTVLYNFASTFDFASDRRENAAAVHESRGTEQYLTPFELSQYTPYAPSTSCAVRKRRSILAIISFAWQLRNALAQNRMWCTCYVPATDARIHYTNVTE